MVTHRDMKMTVLREEVSYTYRSLETGGRAQHRGHMGQDQGSSGAERVGKMWARAFVVVSVGRSRQGRACRFRIG